MIETPDKPRTRTGAAASAPPDPSTRVMLPAPPPDVASRYEHACAECGLPLHEDQIACLNCGAMVEEPDGSVGVRRAALGSVTALMVLGSAVGAAIAGLPHGKDVPKPATAQVFGGQKSIPPATAGTNGTAVKPVKPLPGADTGKAPPPIAPLKPGKPKANKPNRKPASGSKGGSSPSGSSNNSSSNNNTGSKNNNNGGNNKPPKPALTLFTKGEQPQDAGVFGSSTGGGSNSTDVMDNQVSTGWVSTGAGSGVWVKSNGAQHGNVGVVSKTGGYTGTVYSTNADTPPTDLGGWTQETAATNADKKQKFHVQQNQDATYFLLLVSAKGVSINEIQLLP
jgi:hypothetical protein